jgi:hypothetical protein
MSVLGSNFWRIPGTGKLVMAKALHCNNFCQKGYRNDIAGVARSILAAPSFLPRLKDRRRCARFLK